MILAGVLREVDRIGEGFGGEVLQDQRNHSVVHIHHSPSRVFGYITSVFILLHSARRGILLKILVKLCKNVFPTMPLCL